MTVADRWFYFPMVGILGISGIIIRDISDTYLQSFPDRKVLYSFLTVALISLLIVLSIRTVIRNFNYKDNLTLYSHDSNYSPKSLLLENDLGSELMVHHQLQKAREHLEASVAIMKFPSNLDNLAMYYAQEGNVRKADQLFSQSLSSYSEIPDITGYYFTLFHYSVLLMQMGHYSKATSLANKALTLIPNDTSYRSSFIVTFTPSASFAALNSGDYQDAFKIAELAYKINPNEINKSTYEGMKIFNNSLKVGNSNR